MDTDETTGTERLAEQSDPEVVAEVLDRLRDLTERQLVETVVRDLRDNPGFHSMSTVQQGPIDALGRIDDGHSGFHGPYAVLVHHDGTPLSADRLRAFLRAVEREDCVLALVVTDDATAAARSLADGYATPGSDDGTLLADPMLVDLEHKAADMVLDSTYGNPTGAVVEDGAYRIDEQFWAEIEAIEE